MLGLGPDCSRGQGWGRQPPPRAPAPSPVPAAWGLAPAPGRVVLSGEDLPVCPSVALLRYLEECLPQCRLLWAALPQGGGVSLGVGLLGFRSHAWPHLLEPLAWSRLSVLLPHRACLFGSTRPLQTASPRLVCGSQTRPHLRPPTFPEENMAPQEPTQGPDGSSDGRSQEAKSSCMERKQLRTLFGLVGM